MSAPTNHSNKPNKPNKAHWLADLAPPAYKLADKSSIDTFNKTAKPNKTIMVQGTTSDAGKSMLVAALCRILVNLGHKVAPFKPQNMALNSAVTADGGEIGRAQAVQAQAAKVPAHVDFNPILLKPQTDTCAQVIVHGKALSASKAAMEASTYQDYKKVAMQAVLDSHQRLASNFDYVVVEGAGSPAEINLREGDIANMGFAERVDCPVILIADIDKGGVFAHLVGTLALLSASEQQRVAGFVINRFRGDIKLLEPGLDWLEQKTGKPVLGVIPYIHGLNIAAEDAVNTEQSSADTKLKVVVPVYPRMSNHTDFDALRLHPEIDLQFIFASETQSTPLPACDLIMLAGSKSVQQDLEFLKAQGWDKCIAKHLRYGGKVFGICGGYQMLGQVIEDPLGIETQAGSFSKGLGYLPITTTLAAEKQLTQVQAELCLNQKIVKVTGYEIHAGISKITDSVSPLLTINQNHSTVISDGAISADNQVAGTYLHGIFDSGSAITELAKWCRQTVAEQQSFEQIQENAIEQLAEVCQQHLDIKQIEDIIKRVNA